MIEYNQEYYNEDRQAGVKCFLDGRDAYAEFNADLYQFQLSPGKLDRDYSLQCGGSGLFAYGGKPAAKELQLEFYVGGPSYEEAQTNISNLLMSCRECVISRLEDVFEYPAVLIEQDVEETDFDYYYLVKCEFACVRRMPMVDISLQAGIPVYNPGNTESGLKIAISPERDVGRFQVSGITITGLKAGTTYIIDGIEGRVTANGVNYFAHTDLIDFPKIKPGMNEITASEQVLVTLSFYPVFA